MQTTLELEDIYPITQEHFLGRFYAPNQEESDSQAPKGQ